MENFVEQPYSELIYRFMDGETSGVQQKVLFDALANDSELQFEFQQAVAIVKGFNADKMALIPPARLTNTVFASAGFNAPLQFPQIAATNIFSKFKSIAVPVSSALVGALLSAIMFFGFYNNDNSGSFSSQPVISNNSTNNTNILNQETVPNVESKIIHKSRNETPIANENNITDFFVVPFEKIGTASIDENNDFALNINNSEIVEFDNNPYEISSADAGLMNLNVEVKGNTNLAYLPGRDIAPEKFDIANNIALGLLYEFNNTHSAGLYIGKESLQMYTYQQVGENYVFDLEPSLFWAGVCYKYTGGEIYGSIHPFSETILAGSKFGPVAKTSVGLTYNPENFISMSIGLEGSSLVYKFLGEYKTTEKVSLIYNIGFHF